MSLWTTLSVTLSRILQELPWFPSATCTAKSGANKNFTELCKRLYDNSLFYILSAYCIYIAITIVIVVPCRYFGVDIATDTLCMSRHRVANFSWSSTQSSARMLVMGPSWHLPTLLLLLQAVHDPLKWEHPTDLAWFRSKMALVDM